MQGRTFKQPPTSSQAPPGTTREPAAPSVPLSHLDLFQKNHKINNKTFCMYSPLHHHVFTTFPLASFGASICSAQKYSRVCVCIQDFPLRPNHISPKVLSPQLMSWDLFAILCLSPRLDSVRDQFLKPLRVGSRHLAMHSAHMAKRAALYLLWLPWPK